MSDPTSNPDRWSPKSGELVIEDPETGERWRIGDVPDEFRGRKPTPPGEVIVPADATS